MSFDEVQFPTSISLGAESISRRNVDVIKRGSGYEVRNERWRRSLRSYDISLGIRDIEDVQDVIDFWEARGGRARGFRFKDWADYEAVSQKLSPDGSPTVQLIKTYSSSNQSFIRDIKKPVSGTLSFERGGSNYDPTNVDTTTGIVTLSKDKDLAISNISATSPTEITTSSSHGLSTDEYVWIMGTGLSEIDDQVWQITVIDTDTVSLNGSDTSSTSGSSLGSLEQYVQPGETLTWSGEFDVAVRFQDNQLPVNVRLTDLASIPEIPLVEIRI